MKYIMLRTEDDMLVPVIFPNWMVHSIVTKYVKHMLNSAHQFRSEVVSAGDIYFTHVNCSGKSETLGVQSLPGDAAVIESYDYTNGLGSDDGTTDFLQQLIQNAMNEKNHEPS